MKLTFRKHEVKDLARLQALVSENAEAIEPGFHVIAQSLNLGRSTVDLAGLDSRQTPVLVALGFTADDEMLFRMLEAYAWCLEYPESVRRLVPVGESPAGWPPRVVFVGERVLESFLRKIKLLKFPGVDCFEFRCVEVNGATGFYLDPVDWTRPSSPIAALPTPHAPLVERSVAERPFAAHGGPRPAEPGARSSVPRPVGAEPREEHREPPPSAPAATALVTGQSGTGDHAASTPWLELLTTPIELGALKTAPAAEPAPPATASAVAIEAPAAEPAEPEATAEPGSADQAGLDGFELPPNRDLAPTWRKFLEKLTGTFDGRPASQPEEAPTDPTPMPAAAPEPRLGLASAPVQPAVAPTPVSARPARNGSSVLPVDELIDKQRVLLEGLKLPVNGELAPQWRKFFDKPAIDDAKIGAVREYLNREFPLCTIYDFHEFQRGAQVFQLQDNHGKVSQQATITAEFFEARRDSEIRPWFEKANLAQAMRQAGQAGVLVTNAGLQAERR
jgi:hypothetical protein